MLEALSPAELRAAVAHEAAHVRSRDNWVRLLFLSCPDVLGRFAPGRRLAQSWEGACEGAADEHAGSDAALDLASVLVKVARLAHGASPMPAGSFIYDSSASVTERVARLVASADGTAPPAPSRRLGASRLGAWVGTADGLDGLTTVLLESWVYGRPCG